MRAHRTDDAPLRPTGEVGMGRHCPYGSAVGSRVTMRAARSGCTGATGGHWNAAGRRWRDRAGTCLGRLGVVERPPITRNDLTDGRSSPLVSASIRQPNRSPRRSCRSLGSERRGLSWPLTAASHSSSSTFLRAAFPVTALEFTQMSQCVASAPYASSPPCRAARDFCASFGLASFRFTQ